jgi:hypothetical protein
MSLRKGALHRMVADVCISLDQDLGRSWAHELPCFAEVAGAVPSAATTKYDS